jgi:hypothetical protein
LKLPIQSGTAVAEIEGRADLDTRLDFLRANASSSRIGLHRTNRMLLGSGTLDRQPAWSGEVLSWLRASKQGLLDFV